MKIIFLDFDGVMNPPNDVIVGVPNDITKTKFGPEAVKNLNFILEQTGAFIVVSSTWRQMRFIKLKELMFNNGIIPKRVMSVTPMLRYQTRGDEISQWLESHNCEVESFVIIDDGDDMGHLKEQLVQTDYKDALTLSDAHKAIEILNRGVN
jgi:hypothetical protein